MGRARVLPFRERLPHLFYSEVNMAKSVKAFLEREDRLHFICSMAKTKAIHSGDIIKSDPKAYSRSNVSLYFEWLVENAYLRTERRVNPENGKSMNYYTHTGKEYKKKTLDDYYNMGIGRKYVAPVPVPTTFKPHPQGRIIKLLDNPLPRAADGHRKGLSFGVQSSFSMYD